MIESTSTVNRWVGPEWAKNYLDTRDSLPHRAEGHEAMRELLELALLSAHRPH